MMDLFGMVIWFKIIEVLNSLYFDIMDGDHVLLCLY